MTYWKTNNGLIIEAVFKTFIRWIIIALFYYSFYLIWNRSGFYSIGAIILGIIIFITACSGMCVKLLKYQILEAQKMKIFDLKNKNKKLEEEIEYLNLNLKENLNKTETKKLLENVLKLQEDYLGRILYSRDCWPDGCYIEQKYKFIIYYENKRLKADNDLKNAVQYLEEYMESLEIYR